MAQDATTSGTTRPLQVPEGVAGPIADFIAVCSRAVDNLSAASRSRSGGSPPRGEEREGERIAVE